MRAVLMVACCVVALPAGPAPTTRPALEAILRVAPKSPPLPAPTGKVVRVATADELRKAVASARPGTTILLADGKYAVNRLRIRQDRLALRGASGDRDKVILDGGGRFSRVVEIQGAKDLLIANLTVANSGQYGIFFYGDSDVQRLKVYNVKFHNCFVRGLKGTHAARIYDGYRRQHPPDIVQRIRPSGGEVRYCLFVNDRANPHDRPYGGDYIGGIDIMWAKDWVIADNVFANIRGQRGGGRGAIFVWVNSEGVVAERNLIYNCDRGICFGNPSGSPPHMTGGIVRNNFIVAGASQPIEICQTVNTCVYGNTVYCADPADVAVEFTRGAKGGRCSNNLLRGRLNLPKEVTAEGNVTGELEGYFVNPLVGDLHLTDEAVGAFGKARTLKELADDFDRQRRKARPDVGADETPSKSGAN